MFAALFIVVNITGCLSSLFSPSQVFLTCIQLSISPLLFQHWHFSIPGLQSLIDLMVNPLSVSSDYWKTLAFASLSMAFCPSQEMVHKWVYETYETFCWEPWERWFLFWILLCLYMKPRTVAFISSPAKGLSRPFDKSRPQRISETRTVSSDWTTADLCPTSGIVTSYMSLNKLFNVVLAAWIK